MSKLFYFNIFLASAVLTSCGLGDGDPEFTAECDLNADQEQTFIGRWPTLEVPIAFYQGHFSAAEIGEIVTAASSWNSFYVKSQGYALLDYEDSGVVKVSTSGKPSPLCNIANSLVSGGEFIKPVVIYKRTTWPYSSSMMALTSNCTLAATPLNNIHMSIIEINYQHFFTAGNKVPDMESIMLHELGHLVGLHHSCEISSRGFPDCSTTTDDTYLDAVMYPIFSFPDGYSGEVRRKLRYNDMARANCLYPKSE